MSEILLSILIPTVAERSSQYMKLESFIREQIKEYDLEDLVEIISICDNKEMTIGEKREKLYKGARGEYSWQIDDDDFLNYQALPLVIDELKDHPDCVGFKELCIFDGKRVESSSFSLRYPCWMDNYDGFNHVRTPFFKTPIKTRVCIQVPIQHSRFGEDHQFARDIYPLLEKENYIDEFVYHYIHNSSPHNERYGIQ